MMEYSAFFFRHSLNVRTCNYLESLKLNNILKYVTATLLSVPLISTAAPAIQVDRQSFISLSDSLAYEFGKAYQMGKNCNKELGSIAPPKAAGLFINYMKEDEVQKTMGNYEGGLNSKKGSGCEKEELQAYLPVLQTRLANYIKVATPFMRPYTER